MVTRQHLLCKQLQVSFNDSALLKQALTHRSAGSGNNERLEYLGDAVLNFVIADALFCAFPQAKEGKLTQLRASLVKGATLAEIARKLHLGDVLILGPGELKSSGYYRESILVDALESLIGAIYLDSGMESVRLVIMRLFDERLNVIDVDENMKDAKTRLQELLQSKQQPLPIYSIREIKGDTNQPVFEASCQITLLNKETVAQGLSHRKAEQKAAAHALALLGIIDDR